MMPLRETTQASWRNCYELCLARQIFIPSLLAPAATQTKSDYCNVGVVQVISLA